MPWTRCEGYSTSVEESGRQNRFEMGTCCEAVYVRYWYRTSSLVINVSFSEGREENWGGQDIYILLSKYWGSAYISFRFEREISSKGIRIVRSRLPNSYSKSLNQQQQLWEISVWLECKCDQRGSNRDRSWDEETKSILASSPSWCSHILLYVNVCLNREGITHSVSTFSRYIRSITYFKRSCTEAEISTRDDAFMSKT